ncbi:MBG domain-containing protein [uncultured Gimesia sp.]|jgi:hypothetical protein|uniref:MBG domain-containing protein n=1 Tax=uncultured Gimesia sp. TaxID=1678688 RepID=UPI002603986E|nr:MBG domain-containing protein [uncultured Gimesia sp.]
MNGKLFLGIFCLLLIGCSQAADDSSLTSVSGKVTYQGEPVRDGVIRLSPAAGSQAPARTTQIKAGQYQFAERTAVKAGTYQVEINAFRGGSGLPGDRTEDSPEREQFLPEQFNTKTEIEAFTVKPGASEIQQDFDLK